MFGAQRARCRAGGWRRHAQGRCRNNHHADGVARHVEEFDRVGFFGNIGHGVPLHDRADVAGSQAVLSDIAGQDHVPYISKGMS